MITAIISIISIRSFQTLLGNNQKQEFFSSSVIYFWSFFSYIFYLLRGTLEKNWYFVFVGHNSLF